MQKYFIYSGNLNGELSVINRFLLTMLAAIALSGCATPHSEVAKTSPEFTTRDELAVGGLVSEFAATWNRHDMNAMHELDTEDVEWINVVGHYWRGKTTVYKGHESLHKVLASKSIVSIESMTLHTLTPTVVVEVATLHFSPLVGPDGKEFGPPAKTRASFIMVKRDGVWKIAHFQNTEINPKLENDDLPNWGPSGLPPEHKPSN
jgi:uncharacterized protein (TIGR02246 family)